MSTDNALANETVLLDYLSEGGSVMLRWTWQARAARVRPAMWVNARDPRNRRPARRGRDGRFQAPDGSDWLLLIKP